MNEIYNPLLLLLLLLLHPCCWIPSSSKKFTDRQMRFEDQRGVDLALQKNSFPEIFNERVTPINTR